MSTNYQHLGIDERVHIQFLLGRGFTVRAIARTVNRAPSTIGRELERNGWVRPSWPRGPGRPAVAGGYRAVQAQQRADAEARHVRKPPRLRHGTWLWTQMLILLSKGHSPEQIAGILQRMHPGDPERNASHETIYTAIYAMPRGELRTEVIGLLRQARRARRPRARGENRRGQIPDMVSIHLRPPQIDERVVPGHWEGDTIKGSGNASAVGTLVERTTLFVTLAKLADSTANSAVAGFSRVLNRIDAQKRISMTYDQGKEMAAHAKLADRTGIKVYFADPHSPWQRGINENTNGLLRQYLPKGADLSVLSQKDLDNIAFDLNVRPRKSLGWKCPLELFMPESFNYESYYRKNVALQT
jgi:transposase, IS30 family